MPSARRSQHQPTDDWQQLRLLVNSPEQETYELLRPIVLFGRSSVARARETGVPERTLRRKAARFGSAGMRSLFAPDDLPESDRRRLPLGIRKAIVELKAECPALRPYEIATICRHRFGRAVGHHTVERVLATEPLPLHPPRRFPRYRDIPDPVARRKAIVDLYEEGWTVTRIAECLVTSRSRVYDTLQRWVAEDLAGLADRSRAPHRHARKVDLKAMVAIRRLQANPELGEFRIHAALEQLGIHLSPRTCGRILALHRDLGAPRPAASAPHAPQPMPFAAQRRHQYWTVDVRYVEDHQLGTGKPVYVISVLENFSRALLASAITPRQDLTAYLIVLRAAVEIHGAPEALVSDGGTISAPPRPPPSTGSSASARSGSIRARPGRATSRRTSTSCAAWPTTTSPAPRTGRNSAAPTRASSTTTTTRHIPPIPTAQRGGGARPRCWAGCTERGATRPTSTGSFGCGRRRC